MELLKQDVVHVIEHVYIIQRPKEGVLIYKEYSNDKGRCTKFTLRSENGLEINDPSLVEEIQEFVDKI
jgi:hypothetical protein